MHLRLNAALLLLATILFACTEWLPLDPRPGIPRIVPEQPTNGQTVGTTVTFKWHTESPLSSYRYDIVLDKGADPCDGSFEVVFEAGTDTTCLEQLLNSYTRFQICGSDFFPLQEFKNHLSVMIHIINFKGRCMWW